MLKWCCTAAALLTCRKLLQPLTPFHNMLYWTEQWFLPLINLHVCDCSVCAIRGGGEWGHISLSQGTVRQIFLTGGGVLSPAFSCVNFQNQVIVQHPNNQMWDSHSGYYLSFITFWPFLSPDFSWPFKELPWIWSKKDLSCPAVTLRDGNRQLDRQKAQNCWSTLLHQKPKPHDTVVFASDHDYNLIDLNECQNRT